MAEEAAGELGQVNARQAAGRGTLTVIIMSRLALNIQFRIVYPFLPAIGRGLGIPLESASLLLTARALVGAASPLLGMEADRAGHRKLMLAGLAILVAGAGLVVVAPAFGWVLAAFGLLGLAKAAYDPAMQAYVADTVPYARRGRVMGLLELAWSGAWLLGVPAAGFLIATYGWRSPYFVTALLGAACLAATAYTLKPEEMARAPGVARRSLRPALKATVGLALLVNFLQVMAVENVFVVYGAWLEDSFGLSLTALGIASMAIAVAEMAAEGASAGSVDRLGKRRAVLLGILVSVAAYLLLPRLAWSLATGLAGICLMFLAFEFSIVSTLPLISELAPDARATVMALNIAVMGLGRAVASLSGPRLWTVGGLSLNAMVSAGLAATAAFVLWLGVHEHGADRDRPPYP